MSLFAPLQKAALSPEAVGFRAGRAPPHPQYVGILQQCELTDRMIRVETDSSRQSYGACIPALVPLRYDLIWQGQRDCGLQASTWILSTLADLK